MVETMLFLFIGVWIPSFVYLALFIFLFREGLIGGVDSSGDNFKQTVQWLAVVVLLLFLNYLTGMYIDYPEYGSEAFQDMCKSSLSKVYLIASFISSILIVEYRLEYPYIIRLSLMIFVFIFLGTFLNLSYLLGWNFPGEGFIGKSSVILNFLSFVHILCSFRRERFSNKSIMSGMLLLSSTFLYQNVFVEGNFMFDYILAVVGITLTHIYVIIRYLHWKKSALLPKEYSLEGESLPIDEPSAQYQSKPSGASDISLRVKLISYLEDEKPFLNKELTMDQVADRLSTNKTYLSKIINVEMGRNFRDLINYYRVKEAIRFFNENEALSIKELQEMAGFNNTSSFTSAFKVNTGSTPGEWCKDNKSKRRTENGQFKEKE